MIEESLRRKRLAITQRVAGISTKGKSRGCTYHIDVPLRIGDLTFEGWITLLDQVALCPFATDPFGIVLEGMLITVQILEHDDPKALELNYVPKKDVNMIVHDEIPTTSAKE